MQKIKTLVKSLLKKSGYEIRRYKPVPEVSGIGHDPLKDMRFFLGQNISPVIFDVGANAGQSVHWFKAAYPDSFIHSFEPSPATFQILEATVNNYDKVKVWNYGVGASAGTLPFYENERSDMSSFLEKSRYAWGNVEKITQVPVITLDAFASENGVTSIDILKSDTQGFEFDVLKGAAGLMRENKIRLIYLEHIFSDMYKGLTPFPELMQFLLANGFSLVSFYDQAYQDDLLSWADIMFLNKNYQP